MLKNKRLAIFSVLTFLVFTLIFSINVAQDSTHNQLPENEHHSAAVVAGADGHVAEAHADAGVEKFYHLGSTGMFSALSQELDRRYENFQRLRIV